MATVTPTFTQSSPSSGVKIMYFYIASASAADTFTVSDHFSSVRHAVAYRTPATGTVVTMTISSTTLTFGSGPSSEAVSGYITGIA